MSLVETVPKLVSPRLLRVRSWTVPEYFRPIDAAIIADHDPVFLWKGRIVREMGKNWPHVKGVTKLSTLLVRSVPPGYFVQQEQPVAMGDDSVPEPDVSVVRGEIDDLSQEYRPSSSDVAMIVEVADSSPAEDQGEVLESYAVERIPIYWIVNLRRNVIQVYTDPSGPADHPRYPRLAQFGPADEVAVVLDGLEVARIAARDVLPST